MKDVVRNLLFIAAMLFAISYDSCTIGVDYDEKYKLYPEIEDTGCVIVFPPRYEYGNRWRRLGWATGFGGFMIVFSLAVTGVRKSEDKRILSIFPQD